MMEGLTVGPDGNVYVSTFDPTRLTGKPAQVLTFDRNGKLLNREDLFINPTSGPQPSTAMLGVAFRPEKDMFALRIIDFGAGNVLSVNPETGESSVCIKLDNPPGNPGLNAMTFDTAGNTYISDSFNGIIWRLDAPAICGTAEIWAQGDILKPDGGVPGFGANGIEFNNEHDTMFVCNTAFDWIVKIPVADPTSLAVFTNSINGCDGIAIDKSDNIWAAANQADEIVVVDPTGKAIAKLGDFDGVNHGVTNGLLFPASPAFSKDGQWLYVTNLELDLRILDPTNPSLQTVDSQWAAQVEQHSIARLGARIPPIQSSQ
jgi:hypothetical protein